MILFLKLIDYNIYEIHQHTGLIIKNWVIFMMKLEIHRDPANDSLCTILIPLWPD